MKYKTKINVLIIAILIAIIIYFLYRRLPAYENYESKQQIWTLSFGGGGQNYYDAVNRIKTELTNTNVFDKIMSYIDTDLKKDTDFWKKHGQFIEANPRGYGYWLWKPYLIMKTFETMNDGDILFYIDSGCEITDFSQSANEKLNNMIENCNNYDILYTETSHDEKKYTKMDIFKHMNLMNQKVMDSIEHAATLIIIKKGDITTEFIKEWYTNSCNYNLIDDSPSALKNDPSFVENRHDQSIFSLLLKTDKYSKLNTNNNIIIDTNPFLLSRKRSG